MEHLIKNVEDFRSHVRISNVFAYTLFLILGVNSLVELFSSQTLGAKIYLGFIIALMLFLAFYFYKNRSNLPLPMDVTKESMEEYQKKQLRRYLNSLSSMIWWGILPLGHGYLGVLLLRGLSGFSNILGTILLVVLLVWVYRQNKIWFEKYNKQYVKLGGKITVWFSL